MNALEGIWAKAQEEFRVLREAGPGPEEPEYMFCLGYSLGLAFGLALSTVRPDMVREFEPLYRKRGWLQEHEE